MLSRKTLPGGSSYLNAQALTAYSAVVAALVGGSAALITQLSTRKRTEAETRLRDAETRLREAEAKRNEAEAKRNEAEADRNKAETARLLLEMNQPPSPQPPRGPAPRGWFLAGSNSQDYDTGTEPAPINLDFELTDHP